MNKKGQVAWKKHRKHRRKAKEKLKVMRAKKKSA